MLTVDVSGWWQLEANDTEHVLVCKMFMLFFIVRLCFCGANLALKFSIFASLASWTGVNQLQRTTAE